MNAMQRTGVLACTVMLLVVSQAASAQPVTIANVPDWNQPATYADFAPPPLDPPPAFGGVASWCTPTAASNVMGWLEDQQGFNGLADGKVFNGFTPYPGNDTSGIAVPDGLADFDQDQWRDGTIELGYYMDTQDWLPPQDPNPPGSHNGTLFGPGRIDCPGGIQSYLNAYGNPLWTMQAWNYDQWNGGMGANGNSLQDYRNGGFAPTMPPIPAPVPNNGIDFGDPTLVTWDCWLNLAAANTFTDNVNQIVYYDWTGASGMAHTVTGVGYVLNLDPDGAGGPLPLADWLICHDGWLNTGHAATGFVAVPWDENRWWGNTHIDVPEPMTMGVMALGGLALLRRKRRR